MRIKFRYDENYNEEMMQDEKIPLEDDEDAEEYEDEEYEDEEEGEFKPTARPRRLSEAAPPKQKKPVPRASSLFIFSNTNPYVYPLLLVCKQHSAVMLNTPALHR